MVGRRPTRSRLALRKVSSVPEKVTPGELLRLQRLGARHRLAEAFDEPVQRLPLVGVRLEALAAWVGDSRSTA